MIISTANEGEVQEFARDLLQDGSARSLNQAEWMARVLLCDRLRPAAKTVMTIMIKRMGPQADLTEATDADIAAAIESYMQICDAIALDLCEPAGRA